MHRTRFFPPGYAELEPIASYLASCCRAPALFLPEQAGFLLSYQNSNWIHTLTWRRGRTPSYQLEGQGVEPRASPFL
jgi:hypothetical protein